MFGMGCMACSGKYTMGGLVPINYRSGLGQEETIDPNIIDTNILATVGAESALSFPTIGAPAGTPPFIGNTVSTPGWASILSQGISRIAAPILISQFGGPKPGQYFANSPQGQIAYSLPSGASSGVFGGGGGFGANLGSSGLLIPILLIGGAILLFKR
jgi:hypothetical protein